MPRHRPLTERFWEKVEKTDDCWLWLGNLNGNGYGYTKLEAPSRRNELAHRISWTLHFGPIPEGLFVCHHCDTPPCVRPDHLFLGTHSDNMKDMWRKDRGFSLFRGVTRCKHGHAFTPENTYIDRHGRRACRACGRDRINRWNAEHREEARQRGREWQRKFRARQR
jgi:HNH endonuclease